MQISILGLCLLLYWFVYNYTGLCKALLVCAQLYWFEHIYAGLCSQLYWFVQHYTGLCSQLYWFVHNCTGLCTSMLVCAHHYTGLYTTVHSTTSGKWSKKPGSSAHRSILFLSHLIVIMKGDNFDNDYHDYKIIAHSFTQCRILIGSQLKKLLEQEDGSQVHRGTGLSIPLKSQET